MTSVGSTLGTPVNHAGSNLPTITPPTKVPNVPKGPVALDTGDGGGGLIGLLLRAIQMQSPLPELSTNSPTRASAPNGFATGVLKQLGFDVKNLKPQQIKTLGAALFDEMKSGQMKVTVENLQIEKNIPYEVAAAAAQKRFLSNFAAENGIPLRQNNVVSITRPQEKSPSMCIADHEINYSPNGKDYWVRSKGFLRNVEGIDTFADVTVTVRGEVAGKPVKAHGISSGKGVVTVPDSENAYHSLPMRRGLEIETTAECVKNGIPTKGKKVFLAP